MLRRSKEMSKRDAYREIKDTNRWGKIKKRRKHQFSVEDATLGHETYDKKKNGNRRGFNLRPKENRQELKTPPQSTLEPPSFFFFSTHYSQVDFVLRAAIQFSHTW